MSTTSPLVTPGPLPGGPTPRSLAEALRAFTPANLVTLLEARPDLVVPTPTDLAQLAVRAGGRASVQRALDALTAAELQVLTIALIAPEPVDSDTIARLWGVSGTLGQAATTAALRLLRSRALIWGPDDDLQTVRTLRELLGPYPAGLGPSLAEVLAGRSPERLSALLEDLSLPPSKEAGTAIRRIVRHLGSPVKLETLLESAPPGSREVLDRLSVGPPVGEVARADREVRAHEAATPVDWLLARGLLSGSPAHPSQVVLPREVAMALRSGTVFTRAQPHPPDLITQALPAGRTTALGLGAVAEVVRLVDTLCRTWDLAPVAVLKTGGLGVRELRRTASQLGIDEAACARTAELALAAGLLGPTRFTDPVFAPTTAYDEWRSLSLGDRWARLVGAWLSSPRCWSMIGTLDAKGTARTPLGPGLGDPAVIEARRWMLGQLAEPTSAGADLAGVSVESLAERLAWYHPLTGSAQGPARATHLSRFQILLGSLEEAAWLGATAAGALAPYARSLAEVDPLRLSALERAAWLRTIAESVSEGLPAPVTSIMLQADLTAVAPGALTAALEDELRLMADPESHGGASVFRFSAASIRRALDHGRTADDLLDRLRAISTTQVPQPLSYLVADVSRRHGQIRVGAANAYIRSDDPATLSEVLADKRAAALHLRRLAPTVLVSSGEVRQVLVLLRDLGLAPVSENAHGDVVLGTREPLRAAAPADGGPGYLPARAQIPAGTLAALAAALASTARLGIDRAGPEEGPFGITGAQSAFLSAPAISAMSPGEILEAIHAAAEADRPLWLLEVGPQGQSVHHLVQPIGAGDGRVEALLLGTGRMISFALHRVRGVAPVPMAEAT